VNLVITEALTRQQCPTFQKLIRFLNHSTFNSRNAATDLKVTIGYIVYLTRVFLSSWRDLFGNFGKNIKAKNKKRGHINCMQVPN